MGDVLSFAELIEALRRGDPQAVAELERLYGRHLRRVVGRKLQQKGVKSLADSVEICQDVWLRILQRPLTAEFATPGDLLAYLETMAENRVRALQRAESAPRRDRRRHDPNSIEQREVMDEEPEPVVRIIDGELVAEIRKQLGEVLCQVHDLRCDGLDWAQIGVQLEFAPNALRKRYQRVIARVRRNLGIG